MKRDKSWRRPTSQACLILKGRIAALIEVEIWIGHLQRKKLTRAENKRNKSEEEAEIPSIDTEI